MNNPNLSPITRWAIILFSIEWIIWMDNFSALFNVWMNNPNLSPRASWQVLRITSRNKWVGKTDLVVRCRFNKSDNIWQCFSCCKEQDISRLRGTVDKMPKDKSSWVNLSRFTWRNFVNDTLYYLQSWISLLTSP